MPILGTTASSYRSAVAGGVYDTLATATVSSTTSTITFSSIPQTYKHLEIHGWLGVLTGTGIQDITIQFNSDSSSGMRNHWGWGFANDSTIYNLSNTGNPTSIGYIPRDASNNVGGIYISLMDYTNTSKAKLVRFFTGNAGANQPVLNRGSAHTVSTAAVSSITLTSSSMGTGVLTLYGLKDS